MVLMKLYSGVELLNRKFSMVRYYRDRWIRMRHWRSNESPSMNIAISGALFTLSLGLLELNSQCKEGASDINIH